MSPYLFLYAALLLSAFATCKACSCVENYPQEAFCDAHFVIRAEVLSQEVDTENSTRVFSLRILQTFKGGALLNQTEGIQADGSRERSLLAKAYTPSYGSMCGVELANDTVYLLSGRIWRRRIELSLCDWIQKWSDVTLETEVYYRKCAAHRGGPCSFLWVFLIGFQLLYKLL